MNYKILHHPRHYHATEAYITLVDQEIDRLIRNKGKLYFTNNLTTCEKQALDDLTHKKHLRFKPADKGGAIIVIEKTAYIREALRLLSDSSTYQPLDRDQIKVWWDSTTFTCYIQNHMVPRGLLIKKTAMSIQTPEFKKRWDDILSDCSIKLMQLIVEDEEIQLKKIDNEIKELESSVKSDFASPNWEKWANTLSTNLKELEERIMSVKQKFERDLRDYDNNEIYTWRKERSRSTYRNRGSQPRSRRNVSFASRTLSKDSLRSIRLLGVFL